MAAGPFDPGQPLPHLFQRLLAALQAAGHPAVWLERGILARLNANSGAIDCWLNHAQALYAWQESSTLLRGKFESNAQTLANRCASLRRHVEEERQNPRGGFLGLLSLPRELQTLLGELAVFLDECQPVLTAQADAEMRAGGAMIPALVAEIDALLAQTTRSWPPRQLALFTRNAAVSYSKRMSEIVRTHHPTWQAELRAIAPALPAPMAEVVILVRANLQLIGDYSPHPADEAANLVVAAREMLAPIQAQVELIRDPQQPADWFDPPIEADVPGPAVERVGLAVRLTPEWICFPKGRLVVPLPVAQPPESRPLPPAFADFESALGDDHAALAVRLRDATDAGTLETATVQLYVDWWDKLGDSVRTNHPERADAIANGLRHALQHEFRLFAFMPAAYQDHPDGWVHRCGTGAMATGRVRKIIRPGLHDDQNHLRVPALVEVE